MENGKIQVLLLQNDIVDYRVPVYNKIAEFYDFTVAYDRIDKTKSECRFRKLQFSSYSVGPFNVTGLSFYKMCSQFDVVIILPDMHNFNFCTLPFIPRKYKLICWSIGLRASYTRSYDVKRSHTFADKIFGKILSSCDACIFYMDKAKEFWNGSEINPNKIFIAPNTTLVESIEFNEKSKIDFIFIGTLYRQKGVEKLLAAFKHAIDKTHSSAKLHIVGDGNERLALEEYVQVNRLSEQVIFHGAIYDEKKLATLFHSSLLSFSPTQAGLSVPKSMGYGVPFVTQADAITGGEIYHISSGINGLVYEDDKELSLIMIDALNDPSKYVKMGKRAKNYYENNATPSHMAKGAIEAIQYVLDK